MTLCWRLILGLVCSAMIALGAAPMFAQVVEVPAFLVAGGTAGHFVQDPDVTAGSDGGMVFIWGNGDNVGGFNAQSSALTRAFSADGMPLVPVGRADMSAWSLRPLISGDTRGGFIAAWHKTITANDQLYARLLDSTGAGVGSEFRVDRSNAAPVLAAAVAGLPSGSVFAWIQNGVWARLYDPTGQPRGLPINVAPPVQGNHVDVAALADGGFVVVAADGTTSLARVFNSAGQPLDNFVVVTRGFPVTSVAVSPLGNMAVAGEIGTQIWTRYLTSEGTPVGQDILVQQAEALPGVGAMPDIEFDLNGNLYVVWNEISPPKARIFDVNGNPIGPAVAIALSNGWEVRTTRLADGRFANVWNSGAMAFGNVTAVCPSTIRNCLTIATATATPVPTSTPTPPPCGNGVVEIPEECDDGNTVSGDGCDARCRREVCGNGRVDGLEQCDDGNAIEGDGCDTNCTVSRCGNGIVSPGEECDDGNTVSRDGCDFRCLLEQCGNGRVEGSEECDDGNAINGDGCDVNCTASRCGNGVVSPTEECDDGNTTSGDGCDRNCLIERCGNGRVDGTEECDDGNAISGDGCDANCTTSRCGNGAASPTEECDDGNTISGDGCDRNCLIERCGNGRVEGNEQCDDGNTSDGDACRANCLIAPRHDSVLLPLNPISITIPTGEDAATRVVVVLVRNADTFPTSERPGHVVQLAVDDGDCPAGTVVGAADFDSGAPGGQNTALVHGGASRIARVRLNVSRSAFPNLAKNLPQRCRLRFTARTFLDGVFDPTATNNSVAAELNVVAADATDPAQPDLAFAVASGRPVGLTIPRGAAQAIKVLHIAVRAAARSATLTAPARDLTIATADGTCPPGTVGVADFNPVLPGAQNVVTLNAGRSAHGMVTITAASAGFTTIAGNSPARCSIAITATAAGNDAGPHHSTQITVDVTDKNDF